MILLMVLAIVIPYMQNAQYHAEDEEQVHSARTPTTLVLSDKAVGEISTELARKLNRGPASRPPATSAARAKRGKSAKTFGKAKPRKKSPGST